jgi:virulence factor Mce-like protein
MIRVRQNLTDRMNRARLLLEVRRSGRSALIVAGGVALGLAIGVYIIEHVSRTLFSSTVQVSFMVSDATAVQPGVQQVRFKGIPAGTISSVRVVGSEPMITVAFDTKYGPIYRNARAELRPNTALQDMYLDIVDRGTPAAGLSSTSRPVPAGQTSTSVNIDDVLNTFQPVVRAHLTELLGNLGNGLADRGAQLRTSFVELVPLLTVVGRLSAQIQERSALTKALIHNGALLTTALASSQTQLRTLVGNASVTVEALQKSSAGLNATLADLPPTLDTLQTSFAALRGVLPPVDAAVKSLEPIAGALPVSLSEVRRLNAQAGPAVRALRSPIAHLVPFSQALLPVSNRLRSIVDALLPLVHTVNHTTQDLVACKTGVQGFFQWDASLTKFGDARGAVPRGNLALGATSSGLINDPNEFAPQACTPGEALGGAPVTPASEH